MIGRFDGERLALEELHRFTNGPVQVHGTLYWDTLRMFSEVKAGLAQAVQAAGAGLVSLGLDTWGVDYALLDEQGTLIGNPYHYRDSRTDGMVEEAFRRVPREEIFEQTGIQFMQINTLYQLLSMVVQESPQIEIADTLLMTPDLFNYWLTGREVSERTIASTSQCLNPVDGAWALSLMEKIGIPTRIFPELIEPGTILGELLPAISEETSAEGLSVVAPGCHDTASAVAAVPAETGNWAYLSSGTWSLMGVETAEPVINETSLRYNFTNEGGVCDTIRLLKNITGLWLVQECRRTWAGEGDDLSWEAITQLADAAPSFTALVDPDADDFLAPGDMPARIREYCSQTEQSVPESKGAIVRTVLESLALRYRWVLERLEELVGHRLETLHIVGGGSQNHLLNQFAADAVGRPVVTGPVEATAAGNVLMQMLALDHIDSLEEGRELIRRSFETETYEPRNTEAWDDAYGRFLDLLDSETA